MLQLFAGTTVFGWPLLFIYVFCAWVALTAMVALTVERRRIRSRVEED